MINVYGEDDAGFVIEDVDVNRLLYALKIIDQYLMVNAVASTVVDSRFVELQQLIDRFKIIFFRDKKLLKNVNNRLIDKLDKELLLAKKRLADSNLGSSGLTSKRSNKRIVKISHDKELSRANDKLKLVVGGLKQLDSLNKSLNKELINKLSYKESIISCEFKKLLHELNK